MQSLYLALLSSFYGYGHVGCPQRRSLITLLSSCLETLPYNFFCAFVPFEHSPHARLTDTGLLPPIFLSTLVSLARLS